MTGSKLWVLVLSVMVAPGGLIATPISGSIQFQSVTANSAVTTFAAESAPVGAPGYHPVVFASSGNYAGVAAGTAATWSPFSFSLPSGSVSTLWNMMIGRTTYSFDATSMILDTTSPTLKISGTGIAHITGFEDTLGTWNVSGQQDSVNFSFQAAPGSPEAVPDGGTTVMLLGAALAAVALLRRKLA